MKFSKEVKVGIVTILAIACFIYGFNFLKGRDLLTSQRKFYAVYTDIDGLVRANPLLINGFQVGMVGDIKISPDTTGRIVVTLVVTNDDVKIPKNTIAEVKSSGLLGSKIIELKLGRGAVYAKDGDTLISSQEDNLKEAVNKSIEPLQKRATSLISSIDSVMIVVQEVLNTNTRKNLQKSFESIRLTLSSLEVTSYRLDTMVATEQSKISSILTKVNTIATTLSNNSSEISTIINNFSSISDSIAKSNLKSTINNAEVALAQAASIFTKINEGKGTMGLLVNDEGLYRKLDQTALDLDKLLEDLRLHPNRYVHFSIFGKKETEAKTQ